MTDAMIRDILAKYPPTATFIDTWAANCGAPKAVFIGHLVKMLREITEIQPSPHASIGEVIATMPLNLEEDFLMALRFAYYCKAAPLIPDALYDEAEKEFIDRPEVDDSPLMNPGSDNEADYPRRVKALWLYLHAAREDRRPADCPAAAPTAPPAPRKATKGGKAAQRPPEGAEPSLF